MMWSSTGKDVLTQTPYPEYGPFSQASVSCSQLKLVKHFKPTAPTVLINKLVHSKQSETDIPVQSRKHC